MLGAAGDAEYNSWRIRRSHKLLLKNAMQVSQQEVQGYKTVLWSTHRQPCIPGFHSLYGSVLIMYIVPCKNSVPASVPSSRSVIITSSTPLTFLGDGQSIKQSNQNFKSIMLAECRNVMCTTGSPV
ncbi:hypothetical protein PTI98_013559 [Pleurotus ostreatus]|nr:hypothetical protein PTI98_013559 [Pleurotus ostreatus]